jgi:hypothetical protein
LTTWIFQQRKEEEGREKKKEEDEKEEAEEEEEESRRFVRILGFNTKHFLDCHDTGSLQRWLKQVFAQSTYLLSHSSEAGGRGAM